MYKDAHIPMYIHTCVHISTNIHIYLLNAYIYIYICMCVYLYILYTHKSVDKCHLHIFKAIPKGSKSRKDTIFKITK